MPELTWELILGDPPEPDAEQLAYEKRCAANRRAQCLGCGRFLKNGSMRVRHGATFDLVDYLVWTCPKCGDQSEPMG